MKLVYKGNVLNFHTYPLAQALYGLLGEDFTFITDTKSSKSRDVTRLGREDSSLYVPWAINTNVSEAHKMWAEEKLQECDVLLTLEAYNRDYWPRIRENKVTFFYSERLFKPSMLKPYNPKIAAAMLLGHTRFRNKKAFMLCSSAYLPADLNLYGAYPDKLFKWGYFPETKYYTEEMLAAKKNHTIELLWVGGMSRREWWKHPEAAIETMQRLHEEGINAHLTVTGDGELRSECEAIVKKAGLDDTVTFTGRLDHEEVLEYMLASNIYLFTSDYEEGWGAVLNEAMNQGCAVVASHAAGSAPFLVSHEKNGVIYRCGDMEDLFQKVKALITNRERCLALGIAAYHTIAELWNAETAAARLVELSNGILEGNMLHYNRGPCSYALVVKQEQMYHALVNEMEKTPCF